jgi:hypothetical protein
MGGVAVRRKLSALSSLFDYLCERNYELAGYFRKSEQLSEDGRVAVWLDPFGGSRSVMRIKS